MRQPVTPALSSKRALSFEVALIGRLVGPAKTCSRWPVHSRTLSNSWTAGSLVPTGAGDPLLPSDSRLGPDEVAVSAGLAQRLDLAADDTLEASIPRGQPPNARLRFDLRVARALGPGLLQGNAMLLAPDRIDLVKAFLDDYALPEFGVHEGKPLASRLLVHENMRVYAAGLTVENAPLPLLWYKAIGLTCEAKSRRRIASIFSS